MCPACLSTTWMIIAAGAGSAGGLTALVRKLRGRNEEGRRTATRDDRLEGDASPETPGSDALIRARDANVEKR